MYVLSNGFLDVSGSEDLYSWGRMQNREDRKFWEKKHVPIAMTDGRGCRDPHTVSRKTVTLSKEEAYSCLKSVLVSVAPDSPRDWKDKAVQSWPCPH